MHTLPPQVLTAMELLEQAGYACHIVEDASGTCCWGVPRRIMI